MKYKEESHHSSQNFQFTGKPNASYTEKKPLLYHKRCLLPEKIIQFSAPKRNELQLHLELASWAGESGWAGPTSGQRNNRADRAGSDLNRAAILLTQPGPISG